ncbi:HPr family phosphocarrier protein [Planctomycetota bacterium]
MRPGSISENDFHALIAERAQRLLGLVDYVSRRSGPEALLTRPLLGELLSQAMQLEELLDTYDARNNCRWCSFRSVTAAIKQFSDVGYELLHIKHALPAYRLLPIEENIEQATWKTLLFTGDLIMKAAQRMLDQAELLGLPVPRKDFDDSTFREQLPPGRLDRNCGTRRKEPVSKMVTMLATDFLNLAADSKDVRAAGRACEEEYKTYLEDAVREETLRNLELRFHNLQSQYDTHVAGSQAERQDESLLVLRGHISVVFHLLKTATVFAHYFERHGSKKTCQLAYSREPLVNVDALIKVLMTYSIQLLSVLIACAEHLCRDMLQRYAEVGTIILEIPPYRGFHVRPSTLISKLVLHYGSEVRMKLGEEVYDARMPLELFRANEKINAQKRRWLNMEIVEKNLVPEDNAHDDYASTVRGVVLAVAEGGRLIMYEQPLQLPEQPARHDGTLVERVIAEVTRLLALGKIDVNCEIPVEFCGDKRVLADIELLAQAGYGEDKFGNNIPLPDNLRYLRR